MIVNFSFSNFKSIKEEVTLSFEASKSTELEDYYVVQATPKLRLLKMAAIYGANASGKSNVLEALDFLRRIVIEPVEKKTDALVYDRFAFDPAARLANSVFKICFVSEGIRFDYQLEINPQAIVTESLHYYQPNRALVYQRTTDEKTRLTQIDFGSKIKVAAEDRHVLETSTLWNNTVLGGYLKVNIEQRELLLVTDWFSSILSKLVTPSQDLYNYVTNRINNGEIDKANVIRILQKADFNIVDLKINRVKLPSTDIIRLQAQMLFDSKTLQQLSEEGSLVNVQLGFKHSIKGSTSEQHSMLPYEQQSLGTQRFYQFAGVLDLLMRYPKVAVFDEIESSLHPELLKYFILLFLRNTKESQLVFTTHQRDFLQESDMLRQDVIHFTEKGDDGSTDLYSMTDFDSSVIRKGSSLYNTYKSGKLGATPELEDAYIPMD